MIPTHEWHHATRSSLISLAVLIAIVVASFKLPEHSDGPSLHYPSHDSLLLRTVTPSQHLICAP